MLRSVDGVNLPAPIPGEDARHKISVMDGVLVLNSDGTYICQTIVQTSFMGMVQTEADTIRSQYAPIAGSAIVFRVPPKEMDTVATSGAQIRSGAAARSPPRPRPPGPRRPPPHGEGTAGG